MRVLLTPPTMSLVQARSSTSVSSPLPPGDDLRHPVKLLIGKLLHLFRIGAVANCIRAQCKQGLHNLCPALLGLRFQISQRIPRTHPFVPSAAALPVMRGRSA
jgi:hypothetical protein